MQHTSGVGFRLSEGESQYPYTMALKNIHYWLKIISLQPFLQSKVNLNSLFVPERVRTLIFSCSLHIGLPLPPECHISNPNLSWFERSSVSGRNPEGSGWASGVSGAAEWKWLSQWCCFVQCFVGCIICNWGWSEWENFGSIHRKWIFPDWLIPCWLSSVFLSTTKTFCLVCSCPGPLETVGVFFFHFSTCAKCVRSSVHNA